MNKGCAREIAASPVMIDVTYNGTKIYIENVNENNGTASIRPLNQSGGIQEVPLTNLTEH